MRKIVVLITLTAYCSFQLIAQTFVGTPASCVITQPHSNAYFQTGKAMTINVYSSDIGGTSTAGSVTKVEFFNGAAKLGESTVNSNNTYTYVWNNLVAGTYTITAKATDNSGNVSASAGVVVTVGAAAATAKGISSCKGKYLANIIAGSVPANYNNYWNGVTSENDCKWGSVEGTRDNMNWGGADRSYNHAKNNNMMFRYHALAWGSQYPSWITSLSVADFKAEVIEYMDAVAARFPLTDQVDVLNEQIGTHAGGTGYFRDGLGGNNGGSGADANTGYDWQIWLFRQARAKFPNTKLVLNDYGLENDQNAIRTMLGLVKVLRDRGLIDGFGTQAHEFNINTLSATAMKSSLDLMATSGVPIYVTELDISGTDAEQSSRYNTLLPVYWNHPAVGGITLWGYIEGQTWKDNTGLVSSAATNATDSPAITTIKTFINGRTDVKYPFCTLESTVTAGNPTVVLTAPTAATTMQLGASLALTATATDAGGSVSKVDFLAGTTLISSDNASAYIATFTPTVAGVYQITAKATDNQGNTVTSGAITVTVTIPQSPYGGFPQQIPGRVQFENFDEGGQDNAYNDATTGSETTVIFRTGTDVDIETCTDVGTGYNLGYTTNGEWLEYTVEVGFSGVYDLRFRVANGDQTAKNFRVLMDGVNISNNLSVTGSGGWQTWQDLNLNNVSLVAGKQIMRVEVLTDYVNLNYVDFKLKTITGINQSLDKFSIAPNPFANTTKVYLAGEYQYTFYSLDGKIMETATVAEDAAIGSNLQSGSYILQLIQGDKTFQVLMHKQ